MRSIKKYSPSISKYKVQAGMYGKVSMYEQEQERKEKKRATRI